MAIALRQAQDAAISPELKKEIEQVGFAKTGDIGGQPKTTYWTPDGRVLRVQQSLHEFVERDKNGKVIAAGTRDANLDKGWLLQKPATLKPYCPGCDNWHDTEQEVAACQEKKAINQAAWQAKVKKEKSDTDTGLNSRIDRLETLEKDMGEIKALLKQLIGAK